MAYLIAVVAGFAFGAADQYLGTLAVGSALGTWTWTVSGMSAPWLVVPFLAGMTQERPRRAMVLGLVVTFSALAGYFAMTYSPMESVPLKDFWSGVSRMVTSDSNLLWIAAGSITGPLYGFLGHRWRVARSWVAAALVTLALCFEPLARIAVGMFMRNPVVWTGEVLVGVAAGACFAVMIVTARRARTSDLSA